MPWHGMARHGMVYTYTHYHTFPALSQKHTVCVKRNLAFVEDT